MKVAVFGAGALGAVYGVHLARGRKRGERADVVFVVRPARAEAALPLTIQRVGAKVPERLETPEYATAVPPDADVVLVAVSTDALADLRSAEGGRHPEGEMNLHVGADVPVVVLTPMFPADLGRLRAELGDRAVAALPSVIAHEKDGVVRYWRPPVATRIDEPRTPGLRAVVAELAEALSAAGLRTKLDLGVHEDNPATTACFIALGMAVAVAGGTSALAEDEDLARLTSEACREGTRLGDRLGRPEAWAHFAPALAAPWALRSWVGLLRTLSPEGLSYLDAHFGRKLVRQHRLMIREMIELADQRRLPHVALDTLAARLGAI